MKNKIYRCKTISDLKNIKVNKHNIKYILNYYFVLEDYSKMKNILNSNKTIINTNRISYLFDVYYCICYLFLNDKYNFDKYYYKLKNKEKTIMDIFNSEILEKQQQIFDKKLYKSKYKYNNVFLITYLVNLIRDNGYNSKYLNFIIKIKLNYILHKKDIGINNIYFLNKIINVMIIYYTIYLNLNNTSNLKIEKIINKQINELAKYKNIFNNINYNENIVMILRILISISNNELNIIKNIDILNDFIDNNTVSEYTKFLKNINDNENNKDVNYYIDIINDLLKYKNDNREIANTIYLYAIRIDNNESFKEFYEYLNKIEINKNNYNYNEFTFFKGLINFWSGEKLNDFETKYLNLKFTNLLLEYYFEKINYKDFIEQLNNLESIDYIEIFNWYRLDNLFKDKISWLAVILNKISSINIDFKLINYLIWLYKSILNNQRHLILKEFNAIDNIALAKINNNNIKIYSLLVHLQVYQEWNDEIINSINDVLKYNMSNNEDYNNLLYIILFNLLNNNCDKIPLELLKNSIDNNINNDEKYLYYCSFIYIYKKVYNYSDVINYLFSLYKNNELIDNKIYTIINSIMDFKNNNYLNIYNDDIIYYKNNKYYAKNNKKYLQEIYQELNILQIDNITDYEVKSLIELLINNIYFKNIAKYGKKIVFNVSSKNPKDLAYVIANLNEFKDLNKINKIYMGEKIDTLWLNVLTPKDYIKSIKISKDNKFKNSYNTITFNNKKIITFTSLILLAKLNLLEYIKNYYCTGYTYNYFNNKNNLIDSIIEEKIFYNDLTDNITNALNILKNNDHIEYVSNANILGIHNLDKINKWDQEIFKILIDKPNYKIITEDPIYFEEEFDSSCEGTYSLILDMYENNIIKSKILYNVTKQLEELNYVFNLNLKSYRYILNHSNDKYIHEVLKIINNQNKA